MAVTSGQSASLLGTSTPPKVEPIRVSKDVYYLAPVKAGLGQPTDPRVIIICSWMDAKVRSLVPYMTRYNALYPGATQILILCPPSALWTRNLEDVQPAVEILKENGFFGSSPPNSIAHLFSNGGGVRLSLLAEALSRIPKEDTTARPASCLILDSLPGNVALIPALRAWTAGIQPFPLQLLAMVPLTMLWCAIMLLSVLRGKPDPIQAVRNYLDQPSVLPWMDKKTPRVYMYSREDAVVPSNAVELHIASSREKGYPVRAELFKGTPHVAHGKMDPERYWTIVKDGWSEALNVPRKLE